MPGYFGEIPFEGDGEDDGKISLEDMLDQAIDYIAERCKLDKIYEFDITEIEDVREVVHELIPDKLKPVQCWLLCHVIVSVYSHNAYTQMQENMPERIQNAIEAFKAALGAEADVKVVDMSNSDDPLAKLLKQMPDDPSLN